MTTVVYYREAQKPELHFLGRILTNHAMSLDEKVDLLGVDQEKLEKECGCEVSFFSFECDYSEVEGLEPGYVTPTKFINFRTPNGVFSLEIPWIPGVELWDCIEITSEEVYDGLCEGEFDIDDAPAGSLFEDGDQIRENVPVVITGNINVETMDICKSEEDAIHQAKLAWNHFSDGDKKKNCARASLVTLTWHNEIYDGDEKVLWDSDEDDLKTAEEY